MRKINDKRLLVSRKMPYLSKTQDNQKYTFENDEVLEWISKQPKILEFVFDKLYGAGHICYDHSIGKWRGADYEEE